MTPEFLKKLQEVSVLVTGGAGFIGANLCEFLLAHGARVRCLDNLSTGHVSNMSNFKDHPNFTFIEGDIRDVSQCKIAVEGVDYVLHQAALGSVPRSINDPLTTNAVNITGFLNMLAVAKDAGVKRFVYAASSSTYGDSEGLPKVEDTIGKPLSPYAITKYVNELYADVFHKLYDIDCIGLRYFNVFGRKQDPNGAYAAVIPKFVDQLIQHQSPVINGDGSFSRDFTYIDNVISANLLAMLSTNDQALNTVYNVACGSQTDLNSLVAVLKKLLGQYDPAIGNVVITHGPQRQGDVPHSLASIEKARKLLNYNPQYNVQSGLENAIHWYWTHLNK